MRITSFGCCGYKAFKDNSVVNIKPLTIFIGKNNSGKSALLRLPRLIARAIADDSSLSFPLDVDGLRFGEVFQDLLWGRSPHGEVAFSIHLKDENEELELQTRIRHVQDVFADGNQSIVTRVEARTPQEFVLQWDEQDIESPSYADFGKVDFCGILPRQLPNWDFIETWRRRVKKFEQSIDYLGPLRKEIPPSIRIGLQKKLGIDGGASLLWLAGDDELLKKASTWFEKNFDGWKLHLVRQGMNIESEISRVNTSVNLAYAGQGLHQLLPIVVQLLKQQERPAAPRLLLVEEPELHLHAAAEAPIADLCIDTIRQNPDASILVETHSENILLRVRRRIAEGLILPTQVALYWIEEQPDGSSQVKPIDIDENGEVEWWPTGIFAEAYEDVRAIRRAQKRINEEDAR